MYRVIAIVVGGLALAACSSTPEWMSLDALKPAPQVDTVRFESEPPGAEATTSNGQTCRTPCALALPVEAPLTVTFTLTGYLPESETIQPISLSDNPTEMRPNPVLIALTPAPPPPKPVTKKRTRKPVAKKKPAAKPAAQPAAMTAPPMTPAAPPPPAPWPAAPKQ
ncbi:MAG: hypothetical protein K9G60_08200 [Pseudolabrys sp.]|nr:hypothetical protein [Pseudolabrys sp.]